MNESVDPKADEKQIAFEFKKIQNLLTTASDGLLIFHCKDSYSKLLQAKRSLVPKAMDILENIEIYEPNFDKSSVNLLISGIRLSTKTPKIKYLVSESTGSSLELIMRCKFMLNRCKNKMQIMFGDYSDPSHVHVTNHLQIEDMDCTKRKKKDAFIAFLMQQVVTDWEVFQHILRPDESLYKHALTCCLKGMKTLDELPRFPSTVSLPSELKRMITKT